LGSEFITEDFDAAQWENIEPYAHDLLNRELNCSGCLETLIKDCSTLAEHISEAGTLLSIAMTCDTESEAKRQAYLDFIEKTPSPSYRSSVTPSTAGLLVTPQSATCRLATT